MRSGVGRDRRQVGVEAAPAVELAAGGERGRRGAGGRGRRRSRASAFGRAGRSRGSRGPTSGRTAGSLPTATIRPSRDRDGAGPAPRRVHGGDPTTGQDEVGGTAAAHRCPLVVTTGTTPGTMAGRARMRAGRSRSPERRRRPAAPPRRIASMTSVHLLHAGYVGDRVGSSIVLVRDGDALIVADPGMVANRSRILDPLAALGVAPEAVTHVFLSHHHPDHTVNIALFPNAEVVDFWARYKDDLWLDHEGDGYRLSPNSQLWLTPGHTEEDATLVVTCRRRRLRDDPPVVAERPDAGRRPARLGPGQDRAGRERVLAAADVVIPGHGGPFRVRAGSLVGRRPRRPERRADDVEPHVVDQRLGQALDHRLDELVPLRRPAGAPGGRPGSRSAGTSRTARRARTVSARRAASTRCRRSPRHRAGGPCPAA